MHRREIKGGKGEDKMQETHTHTHIKTNRKEEREPEKTVCRKGKRVRECASVCV